MSNNPVSFLFFPFRLTFNYLMDLRSYYFSRFLFFNYLQHCHRYEMSITRRRLMPRPAEYYLHIGLEAGGVLTVDRFPGVEGRGKLQCVQKFWCAAPFSVWHSFILLHPPLRLLHPLEGVIYIDIVFVIAARHGKSQCDIENKPVRVLERLVIVFNMYKLDL